MSILTTLGNILFALDNIKCEIKEQTIMKNLDNEKLSLYQTLMTHRQHAEKIFWSRIQTLHAIQAAVLVGGYYLWEKNGEWYPIPLLVLGLVLTVLLGILARNDWRDANINKPLMDSLESCLRFSRAQERHCLRSHKILFAIIYLLGGVDLLCIGFTIGSMVYR